MRYHKWAANPSGTYTCQRCGYEGEPEKHKNRPTAPPCGGGPNREPRGSVHRWEQSPHPTAEDRIVWKCIYCELEAETPPKSSPGSTPVLESFLKHKGGAWVPFERMPPCPAAIKIHYAVLPLVLTNIEKPLTWLTEAFGVPNNTITKLRRKHNVSPPRPL
jgi:hypothetical protein